MFVNFFEENMQALGFFKEDPALPEESVMLHLRARGLREQPRKTLVLSIVMSFVVAPLFIVTLPLLIFRRLPSLIVAFMAGVIAHQLYGTDLDTALLVSASAYLFLNAYAIFWWAFLLLFDLVDLLLYGSLTKLWVHWYFMRPEIHKKHFNTRFVVHIFTSRQLLSSDMFGREGDVFFDQVQQYAYDEDAKQKLIEDYWKEVGAQSK